MISKIRILILAALAFAGIASPKVRAACPLPGITSSFTCVQCCGTIPLKTNDPTGYSNANVPSDLIQASYYRVNCNPGLQCLEAQARGASEKTHRA